MNQKIEDLPTLKINTGDIEIEILDNFKKKNPLKKLNQLKNFDLPSTSSLIPLKVHIQ